ncbi:MAG: hypothetical protein ABIJ97_06935 [Bacteroidota bacterium]
MNIFVFVVCGDDEHINALNFSLKYLKHFSKNQINVVTDKSRNKLEINHNEIIDIKTPDHYSHHQASIYLKTGLHKFLDMNNNYCYLDSDVIALHKNVDRIFDYHNGPVNFAHDHTQINFFSPYALNCGCLDEATRRQKRFYEIQKQTDPDFTPDNFFLTSEGRQLFAELYNVLNKPFRNILTVFKFLLFKNILPVRYFKLNKNFKYDKKLKVWMTGDNKIIAKDILAYRKIVEKNSEFRFNRLTKKWKDKDGNPVFNIECRHLIDEIKKKYSVSIHPENWQHWNGGVFLFSQKSVDFLETWHNLTISNFEDPLWRTRDQATLAATVWKFGLQNQKTLPEQFNFIADFYKPHIGFKKDFGFTKDNYQSVFTPYFIHIYHHFGNKSWDVWNGVESVFPLNSS